MNLKRVRFWASACAGGFGGMLVYGIDHWFPRLILVIIVLVAAFLWGAAAESEE